MKKLELAEVLEASFPSKLCVSIYLPYLEHLSSFKEADTQLKSALRRVSHLSASSPTECSKKILSEIKKNVNKVKNLQKHHGVAWFCSEKTSGFLPTLWNQDAFAVVSDTFHVKPLFHDRQQTRRFFVLSVNSRQIKLFARWENSLILLERLSLAGQDQDSQSVKSDKIKVSQILQSKAKDMIQRHLRQSNDPLVLAGSRPLVSRVQSSLSYPYVLDSAVFCNSDSISAKNLFAASSKLTATYFTQQENQIATECQILKKSKKALTDIREIAKAAVEGRIDRLVIAEDHRVWGLINRKTGSLVFHAEQENSMDDDLLDDLSEIVYRHKGSVWVIEKSKLGRRPIYATLRW